MGDQVSRTPKRCDVIEVKENDRQVVLGLSMDREATDNAVELGGGNIAVPHGGGKKR